jgi:hypothetical protein
MRKKAGRGMEMKPGRCVALRRHALAHTIEMNENITETKAIHRNSHRATPALPRRGRKPIQPPTEDPQARLHLVRPASPTTMTSDIPAT